MQEYETNVENVAIIRKEVSKTLRNMPIGEKTDFDIIQFDSVRVSIQRLQKKFRATGLKWSTTTADTRIEVTRVA
jgi:uncharacterized protein YqgV (UPF0045/DUF77 family)